MPYDISYICDNVITSIIIVVLCDGVGMAVKMGVASVLKEIDYKQFNALLDRKTSCFKGVNFIRYVGVDYKKKCSVICKYEKKDDFIHPFSNAPHYDTSCYYYGLHPKFSTENIITAIANQVFRSEESFNRFLLDNKVFFSLHKSQQKYVDAVFAKVIMRMATRFGIIFYCDDQALSDLKIFFSKNSHLFIEEVTIKYLEDKGFSKGVAFLGGMTDSVMEALDKNNFAWQYDECSQCLSIICQDLGEGRSFREIYDLFINVLPPDIIKMCYGSVYYSGVMPRVLEVSKENSYSNPGVQTLKLSVERTTFATLDAFDNCSIIKHPLLRQYYDCLSEFESIEDEAQRYLFSNPDLVSNDDMIASINNYLKASYNTHTVAVSGNILDSEKDLIIAERSHTSIDGGTYYCSVNGQSEFSDANVAFYYESVYEDYPSLKADESYRNDFGAELDRETVAELNIDRLGRNWEYYGIAILGIHNKNKLPESTRRMHFNVLAHNQSMETMQSILLKHQSATEKFENRKIEGLKIWFYKNAWDYMRHFLSIGISFLSENQSIITHGLAFLYLLFMGQLKTFVVENPIELKKVLTTNLLAAVVFINGGVQFAVKVDRYIKLKPYISTKKYLKSKGLIPGLEKWLNSITKKKTLHPIMILMLSLYIIDEVNKS